jgi:preprotein translocase subunit SecF
MADNASGVGMGLIVVILLVGLAIVGFIALNGGINLKGGKDVNVNVEAPKIPTAPEGK